ncbi:glycogen synthase kinase binding protein [Scyliorhinus canicula]|uniref:glycogen synthase kinase binding protein n=1 Tax=Scyliorhinus canicula TaxID=7830 RepID=UPI0018F5538C|nr:glycogen synthase kinase binding protein [Scyliorhinus canicula]
MCPTSYRKRKDGEAEREAEPQPPAAEEKQSGDKKMPRRRESFLLLEQAVTVDSKEIDALVAKIGETLQFQRIPSGSGGTKQQEQQYPQQQQQQQQEPRLPAKCGMCCIERWKVPSRNKPYSVPSRGREPGAPAKQPECGPRYRQHAHQKLEQLLSSGNLIKEAVRRLHSRHHYAHIYS